MSELPHHISSSSRLTAIAVSAFAGFGGILYGYDTGTIGGVIAMPDWLKTFTSDGKLSTADKSLVVSILSAGTFFGALLGGPTGDLIGRKNSFYIALALFCFGVGLQLDTHWAAFIIGRVFAGLGVGMISMLVPMYQSECAPKRIRGLIVGLYQWAITIGIFLAAIVNNSEKAKGSHAGWRLVIGLQFLWAFILGIGMLFLPESPRYLVKRGRREAAISSISRLFGLPANAPEVAAEYQNIQDALQMEKAVDAGSYIDCFRMNQGKNALRTWTGILLQACQQLTGVNFIFYYGTTFFLASGISKPFLITIITNVVNVVSTIPGILSIDRIGRRPMLIYGAIGMSVCEFIVAIVGTTRGQTHLENGTLVADNPSAQKSLIAFVCIYIFFFATTWGPCAYITVGEIFPLAIRSKGIALSVASNWLWNWAIAYATPYLVDESTASQRTAHLGVKVFFIWGATCAMSAVFAYFFVPETKGLSLEQVDELYRSSTIRNTPVYRREILAAEKVAGGEFALDKDKKLAIAAEHIDRA